MPRGTDDHPAFGSPVVGERRRVLDEFEPQYAGEELDGRVVLVNEHGSQIDLHPETICRNDAARCRRQKRTSLSEHHIGPTPADDRAAGRLLRIDFD